MHRPTTDVGEIAEFLRHATDELTVVFCTYDSVERLGETQCLEVVAGRPPLTFNLGIFDEAHKTATKRASK